MRYRLAESVNFNDFNDFKEKIGRGAGIGDGIHSISPSLYRLKKTTYGKSGTKTTWPKPTADFGPWRRFGPFADAHQRKCPGAFHERAGARLDRSAVSEALYRLPTVDGGE